MASNLSICGVCDSLKLSKPAVVWCPDCDEGLCVDCKKRHSVSRGTKYHETISVDKYKQLPAEFLRINQICTMHNDKYQTYCQKHDCPCCHRCVIEKHNTCKDLKAIDDIVQNVKSSNAFLELEESLKGLAKNVANVIEYVKLNGTSLRNEKLSIEKTIINARKSIIGHLDAIQLSLMNELQLLEEKENQKMDDLILKLKSKETAVIDFQKTFNHVKEHASELQVFLAMKGIEKDIKAEEENFKTLCCNYAIEDTHLVFTMNEEIQIFEKNVKSFGQIAVQYLPGTLTFEKQKEKQAQIQNSTSNSIDNISLSLVRSFDITSKNITSCVLLPNGKSVFSCDTEYVLVLNQDGSKDFEMSLKPCNGRDVTFIPSTNSLAVPCYKSHKRYIRMIDLEKRKITFSFTMDDDCYGIHHKDVNSLVIIRGKGIQVMDLEDKSVKTVMFQSVPGTPNITAFEDYLFYTINNDSRNFLKKGTTEGVKCCDLGGNAKWLYEDQKILKSPKGITVDNEGCVYVAGCHSNNVVVLSPDGSQHAVILSSQDGLVAPVGIDYDRSTKQLLVANQSGKVFLYKVNKINR